MAMKLASVVVVLCTTIAAVCGGDEGMKASFVFGDSLVDAGNNNYLPSLSKADIRPNGIDFSASGGQPTGRYTNGRTIADIIGELLGQENYAQPFLAPNTTGRVILNGVNYASGGGGILNGTGKIFVNRLGMDVQLDYFNITRQQLDGLLGKAEAKEFLMKKSIFSITIGSNDFLNNYLLPVVSAGERATETPDSFIDSLIISFRSQLTRLYSLDARKVVVANVGPIGCIPYQKTINKVKDAECVGLPNQLAVQYNSQLRDMLTELNDNLPGAKFVLANVYDLVMELLTNHRSHGFRTTSYACCGDGGQYQGIIPCGPTSTMCDDRSEYVFWDPYHPSEAANLFFAKYIVDGDTRYVSPINLRQLLEL
ncbi:GDSL esterase/lipase At2g23540-like [Musa acuminata AAA Group]|uniref:GDSL esterase/lipase At2g23540-like n=1 Tax=Musa acuminata AAA Group TaxID=214697 RepID=UPI0031CE78BC